MEEKSSERRNSFSPEPSTPGSRNSPLSEPSTSGRRNSPSPEHLVSERSPSKEPSSSVTRRQPSPPMPLKGRDTPLNFSGDLEVGDIIGRGTFGTVHIALDLTTKVEYAVKKVQVESKDQNKLDLMAVEVHHMKKLRNHYLLKLVTTFATDTSVVLVTPLMAYGSCDNLLRSSYPHGLPEAAIALIMKDILKAMIYLHSKHVIHRTIKASHILIQESGTAVLTGFRFMIEMPVREKYMTDRNIMNNMVPYINWLSPEMLLQDSRGFGLNSDMYSFGITICELGNGVVPYSDVSASGVLAKKLEEPPPKLWDKDFLPSQEAENLTPSCNVSSPDNPYQRKVFSQNIKQLLAVCVTATQETRISSDKAAKSKFFQLQAKGSGSSLFRILDLLKPPMRFKLIPGGAGGASTSQWDSEEVWDFGPSPSEENQ